MYAREKVSKLQSLLGKVLVHEHCKTKAHEEQLLAKEEIKVFR